MGYEIEEMLRAVGTEGVNEEEVIATIKEVVAVKIKVNKILNTYRKAQMKNIPNMPMGLGATQEAKAAY